MFMNILSPHHSRRLRSLFRAFQQLVRLVQKARRNFRPLLAFLAFANKRLRDYWKRRSISRFTASEDGPTSVDFGMQEGSSSSAYVSREHQGHPVAFAASRLPQPLELSVVPSQPISPQLASYPGHASATLEQSGAAFTLPLPESCSPTNYSPKQKTSPSSSIDQIPRNANASSMLSEQYKDFWPIAPYYFQRYERGRQIPRDYHDTKIPPLSVNLTRPSPCGWISYSHPEGALYFHHPQKNIFTDADLNDESIYNAISRLAQLYEDFISSNHICLNPSVELVLDYEESGEYHGKCGYYLVNHQHRSVFWLDEFETVNLPDWNEVPGVTSDAHIRHELESQYWYHCELFPHTREVTQELIDEIRDMTTHALGDVSTSPLSTIESTAEELQVMLQTITSAERQVGKEAPGSMCIMSRLLHIRGRFILYPVGLPADDLTARHRFLNFHGQPLARLGRDQAIYDVPGGNDRSYLITLLSPLLFSAPEVHLRTLNGVYVDQIVYAHGINKVISKLNTEWQEFILYATVLLNANVAFLAIQSVDGTGIGDSKKPVQICSYMSIAMSVGSIILGLLLVRQNRTKGKESAPEAMQFMRKHSVEILAILYSLPYALLMWAMLAFLSAFAFLCFDSTDLPTRLVVAAVCVPITVLIAWCIWYAWESHGPNAWWESVFETLGGWTTIRSKRSPDEHEPDVSCLPPAEPVAEVQSQRPWRWVTIFRGVKRASLDSEKTTV